MRFKPQRYIQELMRYVRDTGDGSTTLKLVRSRNTKLSIEQVEQVLQEAARRGYGEFHERHDGSVWFILYGHNVPWTGLPVECRPAELFERPEAKPTDYPPLSPEKVDLMTRRFELCLPLHIPGDNGYVDEGFLNRIWN